MSCAGRTDTGVHATGQVVSFRTTRSFPFDRLALALNSELPHDLTIRETAIVDDGFSARFDALERSYVYALFNRQPPSALLARNAYHVYAPLDLAAMREAARYVIGEHDFRSFCGMLPDGGVTLRTVRSLDLEARGDLIRVQISADGFLHRMVRTIVGTLIECGTGKRKPESISGHPRRSFARERRDHRAGPGAVPGGRQATQTVSTPIWNPRSFPKGRQAGVTAGQRCGITHRRAE